MNKINHSEVPEKEHGSPHGKYKLFRRHLSLALGGKSDQGTWGGGHPFDVELVRLPAGAKNFPLHQHAAQWEMYLILSGSGEVTDGVVSKPVSAGDTLLFPPHNPHQLTNTGMADLTYYVVANQPESDNTFYPETGEWAIKPQRKHFAMQETPYYQPGD
jgi:uncharacterized cupin superfamily protein